MTGDLHSVVGWIAPDITIGPNRRPVDGHNTNINALSARALSVADVSIGSEIREFLTSRRGRITPEQAGLRNYGGRRRVSGLRREEVAMLAGISAEYYTQLERGNVSGVSEDVLEAVVRTLQLDDVEH